MEHIHIANVACGGHAGDEASVAAFRELADLHGVKVSTHLSYPDRDNFGRRSLNIPLQGLLDSLADQQRLMPDVRMVKFHGALYNDSCVDSRLAAALASWLAETSISVVITPEYSRMAAACGSEGIEILAEAFAERRYVYNTDLDMLELSSRTKEYASIHECDEAEAQAKSIIRDSRVKAFHETPDGGLESRWIEIQARSICIHSDSPIALALAKRLANIAS